jgi:hypothetical protein
MRGADNLSPRKLAAPFAKPEFASNLQAFGLRCNKLTAE